MIRRKFKPALEEIDYYAEQAVLQIACLVHEKNIDPDNLIVFSGEDHQQLGQHVFQVGIIKAMQQHFGVFTFFDEIDRRHQPVLDKEKSCQDIHKAVARVCAVTKHELPQVLLPGIYALSQNIAYQAVDLDSHEVKGHKLNSLPAEYGAEARKNPFLQKLYKEQTHLFTTKNLPVCSADGLLQRDITAAGRMMAAKRRGCGAALVSKGLWHVADENHPDRVNEVEIVLNSGFDVVTIGMHKKPIITDFVEAQQALCRRLPAQAAARYHAHVDVFLPTTKYQKDVPEYWRKITAMQVQAPAYAWQ